MARLCVTLLSALLLALYLSTQVVYGTNTTTTNNTADSITERTIVLPLLLLPLTIAAFFIPDWFQ